MTLLRNLALLGLAAAAGTAHAEPPRVVASIAPIHSLVASVMEGVGKPDLLVPAGLSDHDYAMKPSDLRAVGSADLIVWVGEPLEAYLVKPLQTEAARNLALIEVEAIEPRPYRVGEPEHDHAEAADGHHHDSLGIDPHVWLDPVRAQRIVAAVAEGLSEIDPGNAAAYRGNAAATVAALRALDVETRRRLARLAGKPFVTFHDGYSYFVERYGLNQIGRLAIHPERSAGAATVKALQEQVAAHGVACAFAEPQFDPRALKTLAGEAQIEIGVLDAIGSGLDPGPQLYESLIRRNTRAIEDCLASTT